jgi:WD40 repeat protein
VRVWDIEGETSVHTMNCEKVVACMDYIPDTKSIITGHEDGMIRVWDPRSKGYLILCRRTRCENEIGSKQELDVYDT